MNGSISHGSEYYLCIRVEAYFYGWCNANPDFWIWSEEMAQLTTLEFVSGAFRVCKFQSGLLAKYFILANNCSWSHTNVGQTGGDLSFQVPYLFQIHWPHGVFHQKMRSRNLQFLCSLWQLGFFLNVNFSSFRTPPALHSVAKCFAASTQHWCIWNNETSKTAGLCIGVEAYFYGWCNANPDFWIWSE